MNESVNATIEPEIESGGTGTCKGPKPETDRAAETEEKARTGEAEIPATESPAEESKDCSPDGSGAEERPAEETEKSLEETPPEPAKGLWARLQAIPEPVRALLAPFLFWWAAILTCELVIHTAAFETTDRFLTAVLFSAAAAALTSALTAFPTLAGKILSWLVPPALYLIYAVQLVYHDIFNAFVSLIYVSVGGDAITQFWDIALEAILRCMPRLLIMAAPMLAFYVLRGWLTPKEAGIRPPLILLACFAALSALSVLALSLGGTGVSSPYTAFYSRSATVDRWTEHFGLLTAEALDLKRMAADGQGGPLADGLDLTAGAGGARNVLPGIL